MTMGQKFSSSMQETKGWTWGGGGAKEGTREYIRRQGEQMGHRRGHGDIGGGIGRYMTENHNFTMETHTSQQVETFNFLISKKIQDLAMLETER